MSWIRLDDTFAHNPKVTQAGPAAAMLYVGSLCHCGRNLTDGFIATPDVLLLAAVPNPVRLAKRLVEVGLWARVDGGYVIPDYLEFNPSRAEVMESREQRSKAGAKGAHSRWHSKRHGESHSTGHAVGHGIPNGTVPKPLSVGTSAAAGSEGDGRENEQQPENVTPIHGGDVHPSLLALQAELGARCLATGLPPKDRDREEIVRLYALHGRHRMGELAYRADFGSAGCMSAYLKAWRQAPPPSGRIGPRCACGLGTSTPQGCTNPTCPVEAREA